METKSLNSELRAVSLRGGVGELTFPGGDKAFVLLTQHANALV
jgi:hypothetical protein